MSRQQHPLFKTSHYRRTVLLVVLLLGAGLSVGILMAAGGITLPWTVVSGGGGTSAGGPYRVSGSIGQAVADAPASGGTFQLQSGFWGKADVTATPTRTPTKAATATPTRTPTKAATATPTRTPTPNADNPAKIFLPVITRK